MIISNMEDYLKGFRLTFFGVLILTPDTLLIRLINIDPWTMSFWRGSMMAFILLVVYFFVRRRKMHCDIIKLGGAGLCIAALYALNAISFIFAINHTQVANVLLLLASTPLIAAFLSICILLI